MIVHHHFNGWEQLLTKGRYSWQFVCGHIKSKDNCYHVRRGWVRCAQCHIQRVKDYKRRRREALSQVQG
jgi:hypothetical protein